jgi:hypothetical protein
MERTRVYEKNDVVYLSNGYIKLGFSRKHSGALICLMDRKTGFQFIRDIEARKTLFRIALRCPGRTIRWLEGNDAAHFSWKKERRENETLLLLAFSGFSFLSMDVAVRITVKDDSPMSYWQIIVSDAPYVVTRIVCPILAGLVKMGDPVPGESLAVPLHGEGYLFENPYPVRDRLPLCCAEGPEGAQVGIGTVSGIYPGSLSMQMYTFYNDKAGLYLACHDSGMHPKIFAMGTYEDWKEIPVFRIEHLFSEQEKTVQTRYDSVIGVFHGDWYDAADIYRVWAEKQWWCAKKLQDRDIAQWMKTGIGGVFQMSNFHIPKIILNHSIRDIAETVNTLSRKAGARLAALVFNWEQGGAWTGPCGLFPPREGEDRFVAGMELLKESGNPGFVYVPGGCWYLKLPYDPPFESWEKFDNEARQDAVKSIDGDIQIGRWYPGWETTRICPFPPYLKNLTAEIVEKCLDLGCSIVQIDNFPCGGSEACYDSNHGHPVGYGSWWADAWCSILAEVRARAKAKNPDSAITTEGVSECFIPWVDMFDQRAGNMEYFGHYGPGLPMGGKTIPIFSYVYNEYIGAYCAAYPECNRSEVLYWTRCLGKALAQGVIPAGGRYFPTPAGFNPITISFFEKIARATAHECWQYLMFGRMLRPPVIKVPEITAQFGKMVLTATEHFMDMTRRHEVKDAAIQHAAFIGRDGSVGYFFINISEEPVSFTVTFSRNGLMRHEVVLDEFVDGVKKGKNARVRLPHRRRITMRPLSIIVFIARECSKEKRV